MNLLIICNIILCFIKEEKKNLVSTRQAFLPFFFASLLAFLFGETVFLNFCVSASDMFVAI